MNQRPEARRLPVPVRLLMTVLLGTSLAACTTIDDDGHGENTRALLASQQIDPGAGVRHGDRQPPAQGRNVRDAMLRQAESYSSPPTGGVGSAGGK